MVHYPEKMSLLGSLGRIWVMRCESLHYFLKTRDLKIEHYQNQQNFSKTTPIKRTFRMINSIKDIETGKI